MTPEKATAVLCYAVSSLCLRLETAEAQGLYL